MAPCLVIISLYYTILNDERWHIILFASLFVQSWFGLLTLNFSLFADGSEAKRSAWPLESGWDKDEGGLEAISEACKREVGPIWRGTER